MAIDQTAFITLTEEVNKLILLFEERHTVAFYASNLLITLAILSSAGTVAAGLYDKAKRAALLGLLSGLFMTADAAWAPGEKAQVWRELGAQAVLLRFDLMHVGTDAKRYEKCVQAFKALIDSSAKKIPRGGGIAAATQARLDQQNAKTP